MNSQKRIYKTIEEPDDKKVKIINEQLGLNDPRQHKLLHGIV